MATIKDVARAANVSTATVSAVINDSAYVSADLRGRVLAAVRELNYAPSLAARNLKHGRSQLIALVVADLTNPFFSRVVWAAEAAVAAWGYSLLVFNSDEKPEGERRILSRIRTLSCDGVILVPVGDSTQHLQRDPDGKSIPTVLFGRTVEDDKSDTVTIDNISASRQATEYLLDLGHTRLGTITGPLHLTTGRGRLDGMLAAMKARGLAPEPRHIRSGEFREDAAYSVARSLLEQPDRPTGLYVASGVMALGAMRAIADLGFKCPDRHLDRLDRHDPRHWRPAAAADAHRAPGRRHDQRGGAPAGRSHPARQRRRAAQGRVPADPGGRRQLRTGAG